MTNKDWTDQLPGLMEGLEEAAPEGLWDAVRAGVAPPRRRISAWWFVAGGALAAAAAVVLIVFLFGRPTDVPGMVSPIALVPENPVPDTPVSPVTPAFPVPESRPAPKEEKPVAPEQKEPQTLPATPEPDREPDVKPVEEPSAPPQGQNDPQTPPKQKVKPVEEPSAPVVWPTEPAKPRKRTGKWRLDVTGGGLLAQAENLQQGLGLPVGYAETKADAIPYGALTRNVASTTESTHRQGFRASVLMSNHFAQRWSAGMGFSLSSIHSEYTTTAQNSTQRTQKNTLYLGIPLFVQFDVFSYRRFQFYLTGGPLLEMPLQQSRNTQNWSGSQSVGSSSSTTRLQALDPGNWRWSVNLAAGLQFQLFSRGAIFVQPGVCWHIPSSGQQDDFYSARPVAMDLNLGFRFLLF